MKTKEELNALKEEVETVNKKLHELTDEELEQVSGGCVRPTAVTDREQKEKVLPVDPPSIYVRPQ